MSDKKRRHRHKKFDGKSFIILPIIFLFGTYLVLYLALAPSFSNLFSAVGMFFSDNEKDYSTEYENIFVPVSENSTLPTVTKEDKKTYVKNDAVEYPTTATSSANLSLRNAELITSCFSVTARLHCVTESEFTTAVLFPATAEQFLLPVTTTPISTDLNTLKRVRLLLSAQATAITSTALRAQP